MVLTHKKSNNQSAASQYRNAKGAFLRWAFEKGTMQRYGMMSRRFTAFTAASDFEWT